MKFALESKQVTLPSEPEVASFVDNISAVYEDLLSTYMELSDTQRNLDEACQVMENINLSMRMIKAGGVDAIKLLNLDKSLEGLLGVAEEKITVQSAEEGLGDAAKAIWEKVRTFIQRILDAVKRFIDKHSVKTQLAMMESRFKENVSKIDNEAFNNVTVSKTTFPSHSQINEVLSEISGITKLATKIPSGSTYRECCDDFLSFAKGLNGFKCFIVGETNDKGETTSYSNASGLKSVESNIQFWSFDTSMKVIDGMAHETSLNDHGYKSVNDLKDVTKLINHLNFSVDDIRRHLAAINGKIPENLLTDDTQLIFYQCVKTSGRAMSVLLGLMGRLTRQLSVVFSDLLSEQKHAATYAL